MSTLGGPFIVDKLWDSLLGYNVLLFWMLHAVEGMKLFEHLWHGFKANIVGRLFHEWAISFSNAKGVYHLVFFIIWWMRCGLLRWVDNAKNCNANFLKNHKKSTIIWIINF
jgi:hypothetical protein